MSQGSEFLFGVKSGLPPEAMEPAGSKDTGYGPAPYLVPSEGAGSFNPSVEEGLNACNMSTYTDDFGVAWEDKELALAGNYVHYEDSFSEPTFKAINVIERFPWSHSPVTPESNDVPGITLSEHRILQNPSLNAMLYNLNTLTDLDAELAKAATAEARKLSGKAFSGLDTVLSKTLTQGSTMSAYSRATVSVVGDRINKALKAIDQKQAGKKYPTTWTSPYHRLYSTIQTGFKYKLPYFTDEYKSVSPTFANESGHTNLPFQSFMSKATGMAASVVNALNTGASGTYIEQPKYPAFPQEGKQYTLQFPLLNTVRSDLTHRNWELVFMLLYQNTPNRVNRSVLMPPHIYEALIPGVWYSRYAYISRVDITMVGNRRRMKIPVHPSFAQLNGDPFETGGKSQVQTIETIIPDAYNVSITVSELIPESQNYMMEGLRMQDTVDVTISDSPVDGDTQARDVLDSSSAIDDIKFRADHLDKFDGSISGPQDWGGGFGGLDGWS